MILLSLVLLLGEPQRPFAADGNHDDASSTTRSRSASSKQRGSTAPPPPVEQLPLQAPPRQSVAPDPRTSAEPQEEGGTCAVVGINLAAVGAVSVAAAAATAVVGPGALACGCAALPLVAPVAAFSGASALGREGDRWVIALASFGGGALGGAAGAIVGVFTPGAFDLPGNRNAYTPAYFGAGAVAGAALGAVGGAWVGGLVTDDVLMGDDAVGEGYCQGCAPGGGCVR